METLKERGTGIRPESPAIITDTPYVTTAQPLPLLKNLIIRMRTQEEREDGSFVTKWVDVPLSAFVQAERSKLRQKVQRAIQAQYNEHILRIADEETDRLLAQNFVAPHGTDGFVPEVEDEQG